MSSTCHRGVACLTDWLASLLLIYFSYTSHILLTHLSSGRSTSLERRLSSGDHSHRAASSSAGSNSGGRAASRSLVRCSIRGVVRCSKVYSGVLRYSQAGWPRTLGSCRARAHYYYTLLQSTINYSVHTSLHFIVPWSHRVGEGDGRGRAMSLACLAQDARAAGGP